jgi:hypothetical protein
MSKVKDYLKGDIKKSLLPKVATFGFGLYKPKMLLRVKDGFVDVISFQLSRWGSKRFYVHYYKNPLSNPMLQFESYYVGERIGDNKSNGDSTQWIADSEKTSKVAIQSVTDAFMNTIMPWFDEVQGPKDYAFEKVSSHGNDRLNEIEDAVVFFDAGKEGRCWWILSDLLQLEPPDDMSDDQKKVLDTRNRFCKEYLNVNDLEDYNKVKSNPANFTGSEKYLEGMEKIVNFDLRTSTLKELIEIWKRENIEKFNLEKYVS